MDIERATEFVRNNPRAVLATTRRNGTPQLSPVLVGVDDRGRLLISTTERTVKAANVRRDPHAWVCGITDGFFGDWVQIGGDVEVVRLPDAMEILIGYYRGISGEHPDWDDYRAAMVRDHRCVIRITPTSAGPRTYAM